MKEWLPNWKNANEYPDPDTTYLKEWAWEFLRRNPEYQQDYSNYVEYVVEIGYWKAREALKAKNLSGEQHEKLRTIMSTVHSKGFSLCEKYQIRESGSFLPNPAKSLHPLACFENKGRVCFYDRYIEVSEDEDEIVSIGSFGEPSIPDVVESMVRSKYEKNNERTFNGKLRPMDLLCSISLAENISDQLDLIAKVANAQQAKLKEWGLYCESRNVTDIYGNYLRALDAHENEIEPSKIAAVMLPNESDEAPDYTSRKKIRNWITKAKQIRDHGYLKIIKMSVK